MLPRDKKLLRIAQEITEIAKKLIKSGVTYASLGNISARMGDMILITPSGVRLDSITSEQIVHVRISGDIVYAPRRPSVELPMHLEIYRNIKDAKAVIHAHAPFATALGTVLGEIISENEEAIAYNLRAIPACRYAPSGTIELAKNVVEVLKNSKATIIPNHGVVVWEENLEKALHLVEAIEHIAKVETLKQVVRAFSTT